MSQEIKEVPLDAEVIARHSEFSPTIDRELKANIILFSYNRPRMLREAIKNIIEQPYKNFYLWILDDGSDFDVMKVIQEFGDWRIFLAQAPKISIEERIDPKSTRFADNANFVLDQIPEEDNFVIYLCDDDLLHPDWITVCNRGFVNSEYHMVAGKTYYFNDGDDYLKDGIEGFPAAPPPGNIQDPNNFLVWWQVGGFAHLMKCHYEEDVKWGMGYGDQAHSWDVSYVKQLWAAHISYVLSNAPSVYRREHPNTLSEKLGRKTNGLYAGAAQEMTPESVSGLME